MPCTGRARTDAERLAQQKAIDELAMDIATGRRAVVRLANGRVGISDWVSSTAARIGMCDGCVLERISSGSNWLAKTRLAAAGVTSTAAFATVGSGHPHGRGHGH